MVISNNVQDFLELSIGVVLAFDRRFVDALTHHDIDMVIRVAVRKCPLVMSL